MAKTGFRNLEASPLQKLCDFAFRPVNLEKTESVNGLYGWGVLALGILAYDVYAIKSKKIETLTKSFWRTTEKRIPGSIFIGAWSILTVHLLIEKQIRNYYQRSINE